MERKKESHLTRILKQEEWGLIFDRTFGPQDAGIREFLVSLHRNGNRPLPMPPSLNVRYAVPIVNVHLEGTGFKLEEATPDATRKGPQLKTYVIVRAKSKK
jgi:hypothetical protein